MKPRTFKSEAEFVAFAATQHGQALQVLILHDDACSASHCVCSPWYAVRDLTTDHLLEGTRLEAEWRKGTAS